MGTIIGQNKVHFQYGNNNITIKKNQKDIEKPQKFIKCVVSNNATDEVITEATVKLHHKDQDIKIIGRYFAFSKAVDKLEDKKLKAELWQGFKSTCNMP